MIIPAVPIRPLKNTITSETNSVIVKVAVIQFGARKMFNSKPKLFSNFLTTKRRFFLGKIWFSGKLGVIDFLSIKSIVENASRSLLKACCFVQLSWFSSFILLEI